MRKYILIGLTVFLADQVIKAIAISKIPAEGIFAVSTSILSLQLDLLYNTNIAFGIPLPLCLEFLLPILLIFSLVYLISKRLVSGDANVALTGIIAAAVSNLTDRLLRDGVVDFISISVYNFSWPSFNFADIIITGCAIYLLINLIFKHEKDI